MPLAAPLTLSEPTSVIELATAICRLQKSLTLFATDNRPESFSIPIVDEDELVAFPTDKYPLYRTALPLVK